MLYDFFNNQFNSSNVDKIFVKSLCGYGGKGSFCLKKLDLKKEVEKHYDVISKGQYVHQLGVIQHDDINKIYSESVNTIRIDTYIDNSNLVHILAAVMRFGTGGSSLDNVSSGGFFVGINMVEGTLMEYSLQAMIYGGKRYDKHPDTNFTFNNFKIPFFEAAKDLCLKLTKYIPNRLAGWDIAITPDGPMVIEGNHTPYILMGEFSIGGYLKHPLYNMLVVNFLKSDIEEKEQELADIQNMKGADPVLIEYYASKVNLTKERLEYLKLFKTDTLLVVNDYAVVEIERADSETAYLKAINDLIGGFAHLRNYECWRYFGESSLNLFTRYETFKRKIDRDKLAGLKMLHPVRIMDHKERVRLNPPCPIEL